MSDPFLDDEASVESNRPREIYEIVQNAATTYRITSGPQDVTYGGFVYTTLPMARTEIGVNTITNQQQMTFVLPLSHPLSQRFVAQASPPQRILVTVRRLELVSGLVEQSFIGVIISMAIDGHIAKFLVESRAAVMFRRKLPTISAGRLCPHILYDTNCRLVRATYTISTTVATYNGRRITLASIGGQPDHWAQFGELVHVATGERMTVLEQVGTLVTMQAAIPEIGLGSAVTLSAGCAHDVITCQTKFGNQANFGGFPQLPSKNPFFPNGLGVVEQS